MRLILVRHALPERLDVVSDAPDPALSAVGLRQAEALAGALAHERIDAVWSSPLRRAVETAGPLASARGLDVPTHAGLVEFDFGHGVYIPAEEADHPVTRSITARIDGPPDAELLAFRDLVVASVRDVVEVTAPDETVAVVCHGGVINAYLSALVEAPRIMFANVSYTGFSIVTLSRSGPPRIVSVNEHQHLRTLGD